MVDERLPWVVQHVDGADDDFILNSNKDRCGVELNLTSQHLPVVQSLYIHIRLIQESFHLLVPLISVMHDVDLFAACIAGWAASGACSWQAGAPTGCRWLIHIVLTPFLLLFLAGFVHRSRYLLLRFGFLFLLLLLLVCRLHWCWLLLLLLLFLRPLLLLLLLLLLVLLVLLGRWLLASLFSLPFSLFLLLLCQLFCTVFGDAERLLCSRFGPLGLLLVPAVRRLLHPLNPLISLVQYVSTFQLPQLELHALTPLHTDRWALHVLRQCVHARGKGRAACGNPRDLALVRGWGLTDQGGVVNEAILGRLLLLFEGPEQSFLSAEDLHSTCGGLGKVHERAGVGNKAGANELPDHCGKVGSNCRHSVLEVFEKLATVFAGGDHLFAKLLDVCNVFLC
mmetsp:Transcript_100992/g.170754  ORF Transcript_100992/g.170754 Transcript_100992/m.170754 type:complete len:395 (+) Transcript_100992:484-1668(+)